VKQDSGDVKVIISKSVILSTILIIAILASEKPMEHYSKFLTKGCAIVKKLTFCKRNAPVGHRSHNALMLKQRLITTDN
jgi:hypothetical protein